MKKLEAKYSAINIVPLVEKVGNTEVYSMFYVSVLCFSIMCMWHFKVIDNAQEIQQSHTADQYMTLWGGVT